MDTSKLYYAYNVYVGKFWNGHWFCAKRKDAVPVDSKFWDQIRPQHLRNLRWHSPNAKPLKRK